jgi:hypothetical protein
MSFGLFAGQMASSFNSATRGAEDTADLRNKQKDRDDVLEERDRIKTERARVEAERKKNEAYGVGLAGVLGGGQAAGPVAAPSPVVTDSAPIEAAPEAVVATPGAAVPTAAKPAAPGPVAALATPAAEAPLASAKAASVIRSPGGMNNPADFGSAAQFALKNGNITDYMKFSELADKRSWQQSSNSVDQLYASMGSMTPLEVANKAGEIFANDIGAGRIANIAQNKDGSVSFDAINSSNGQVFRRTAKTADDVVMQLRSFYTPENYSAIRAERVKAEIERNKLVTVKTGEQVYQNGKLVMQNTNGLAQDGINPDGSPRYVRQSGSGARKPDSRDDVMRQTIASSSEKADGAMKLSPDQITATQAAGTEILSRNPDIDPYVAASLSIQLMRNPAVGEARLSSTGRPVRVVVDQTTGREVEVADLNASKLTKDDKLALQTQADELVGRLESQIPNSSGLVQRAAFGNPDAIKILSGELQKSQEERIRALLPNANAAKVTEMAKTLMQRDVIPQMNARFAAIKQYGSPMPEDKSVRSRAEDPSRSIFTDDRDRINLLEPFSRFGSGLSRFGRDFGRGLNDLRQRMTDETNANQ